MSSETDQPKVNVDISEPTKGSFKLKADLPANNPCVHEGDLTLKCLARNNYNGDNCKLYQKNYIECQQFWLRVQRDRRRRGLFPALPPPSERESVKAEYTDRGDRLIQP